MPDFIVIDEMSSHIDEKVQELKRSMGLSHQEWLVDYKISGENSYVFNDKDKLHELYKDATICLYDNWIYEEANQWCFDNGYGGSFLSSLKDFSEKDKTTINTLQSIENVANNETAMNIIAQIPSALNVISSNNKATTAIVNSSVALNSLSKSMTALKLMESNSVVVPTIVNSGLQNTVNNNNTSILTAIANNAAAINGIAVDLSFLSWANNNTIMTNGISKNTQALNSIAKNLNLLNIVKANQTICNALINNDTSARALVNYFVNNNTTFINMLKSTDILKKNFHAIPLSIMEDYTNADLILSSNAAALALTLLNPSILTNFINAQGHEAPYDSIYNAVQNTAYFTKLEDFTYHNNNGYPAANGTLSWEYADYSNYVYDSSIVFLSNAGGAISYLTSMANTNRSVNSNFSNYYVFLNGVHVHSTNRRKISYANIARYKSILG